MGEPNGLCPGPARRYGFDRIHFCPPVTLAYTLMEWDAKAKQDAERAIALGVERAELEVRLQEARASLHR
jgi:hypothetical protein